MSLSVFGLILLSVTLSALAQISMKFGMSSLNGPTTALTLLLQAFTQPYVLLGLFLYATGAVSWLLVLSRLEVSIAYPFVALGFILTLVFSAFFLHEPLTLPKILGTGLVVLGVVLLTR